MCQMCGGQFDSPAGFIDFPVGAGTVYSHSISCDYSIHVQPGMVVSLVFTQFRWIAGRGREGNLILDCCARVIHKTVTS